MNARHQRQRQIVDVLAHYGMGYLVSAVGLEHLRSVESGLLGHERRDEPHTRAERLRVALEELGPTFVKVGQLLSTRADLLAPDYRAELAKLQDAVPGIPAEAVQEAIALELGDTPDVVFAHFDPEPLAAASIGQAHAATLRDGTDVVVKIRRPGAVEQIEQDLEILHNLAARASRHWQAAARYDVVGLADELARTLRAELDYLHEARNAERFATDFADDPDVQIPRVFWETTTSRVLTLERMRGIKISDLDALDAAGVDRRELAERATRVTAKMVFENGFFHADPHPGNFFVDPGGRIRIIDFGIVGDLSDHLRGELGRLLVALVRHDPDRLTRALLDLGTTSGYVDHAGLRDDLARLLARYSSLSVGDIPIGAAIGDVLEIVRRHRLTLPPDLALLLKVVIMDEGMAAQLDPDFALGTVLAPYATRFLVRRTSPAAALRRMERMGFDLAELVDDFPGQLRRLLDAVEAGGIEVHLRAAELEPLVTRVERVANRIAASVLAAAVIDALAELATGRQSPPRARRAARFAAGVGAAGSLAAYALRREARG